MAKWLRLMPIVGAVVVCLVLLPIELEKKEEVISMRHKPRLLEPSTRAVDEAFLRRHSTPNKATSSPALTDQPAPHPTTSANASIEQTAVPNTTRDQPNAQVLWTHETYASLEDGLKENYPSAIIIGARKAGTSALHSFLCHHPSMSCTEGEDGFFSREHVYSLGPTKWLSQLDPGKGKVVVLKTAEYFHGENVPSRVFALNNSTKIIIILRNPVVRMVSDYLFMRRYKKIAHPPEKFHSLTEMIIRDGCINTRWEGYKRSLYANHLSRWLAFFPRQQIFIVNGDSFVVDNPSVELEKLERFLQVPRFFDPELFVYNQTKGFFCFHGKCLGEGKGHEQPVMDADVVKKITDKFRPYNERLFLMANMTFDW